jgi:hypothetical protein
VTHCPSQRYGSQSSTGLDRARQTADGADAWAPPGRPLPNTAARRPPRHAAPPDNTRPEVEVSVPCAGPPPQQPHSGVLVVVGLWSCLLLHEWRRARARGAKRRPRGIGAAAGARCCWPAPRKQPQRGQLGRGHVPRACVRVCVRATTRLCSAAGCRALPIMLRGLRPALITGRSTYTDYSDLHRRVLVAASGRAVVTSPHGSEAGRAM